MQSLGDILTEIEAEEQAYTDFDWFCADEAGEIGHFTTAGYKDLPRSVACSAEDLVLVKQFFETELNCNRGYKLDGDLSREIPAPQDRTERYLRSFVAMADKGLYSFDIDTYLKPNICYFRVAVPLAPVLFADLPSLIREILGRTELKGRLLRDSSRVPYEDTMAM